MRDRLIHEHGPQDDELLVWPDDELALRLERFARLRLDQNPGTARSTRRAVMAEAWRLHLAATDPATPGPYARAPVARWTVRRALLSLSAAVLAGLVVGSTVFAASRAGGPLYEARQTLEEALLPGDPVARLQAELMLAQLRLAEVLEAQAAGNTAALEAALVAYADVAGQLQAAPDPTGTDRALQAVQFHLTVLAGLRDRIPEAAQDGLSQALARSAAAIDRLEAKGPSVGPGPGQGKPGQPPGRPDASGATPKPGRTPDPDRTPQGGNQRD
jgi:hypothetical protein